MKPTAFISGHLDLTEAEFKECYYNEIYNAVMLGHNIIIGAAKGCDRMAQEMLAKFCKPLGPGENTVVVFHMFYEPRNNAGNFVTWAGFTSDKERDEYMTQQSTYDLAWVRLGRENSGTASNIKRRSEQNFENRKEAALRTFC
jgi:hypothetical protein